MATFLVVYRFPTILSRRVSLEGDCIHAKFCLVPMAPGYTNANSTKVLSKGLMSNGAGRGAAKWREHGSIGSN